MFFALSGNRKAPCLQVVVKHDILVSPPNRLVHMLQQDPPLLSLDRVEWLIVDEADKLFEAGVSGFREQLAAIHRACSGPGLRRAMFSATLGPEVEAWCRLNMDNLVRVRVGAANSATDTIHQRLVYCGTEAGKLHAFRDIVRAGLQPPVLVFVQVRILRMMRRPSSNIKVTLLRRRSVRASCSRSCCMTASTWT